eukprot:14937494-Ditylum_brightwellii.AAC.1
MPTPRRARGNIHAFVDANHAGNVVTKRSHTCIIKFVQNTPIIWMSKLQNTVESATFGRRGQEHQHTAVTPAEEAQYD